MNIFELSKKIKDGSLTSVELTERCLKAINENDFNGRKLNSVAELNSDALFIARALDKELKEKGPRSPLHGIPVLVKDNIDVKGMHNTAGSYALNDLLPEKDAPVIENLKKAGAVILGKANMSEFAYWMSTQGMPSGFSSRCGQVVHPYVKGVDPSGSSSGSGVAAAARFTPYTIGTETDGSLTSPACANCISTIKPTIGVVSRTGILPISSFQDTAGPMAPTISECALILNYLQGVDSEDPSTLVLEEKDYTAELGLGIEGMKFGIVEITSNKISDRKIEYNNKLKKLLLELGAEYVDIKIDMTGVDEMECLKHEFKNGLNKYLSLHNSKIRNLSEIIEFNRNNAERCLVHGQNLLEESDEKSGNYTEAEYINERVYITNKAKSLIEDTLKEYGLTCLISAQQNSLSAISGNPTISIPADDIDVNDPKPVSYFLYGKAFDEVRMFRVADVIERKLGLRKKPEWVNEIL